MQIPENIVIVGLGLIGGSLAKTLRQRALAQRIIGVEQSAVHARQALELGLADTILPLETALKHARVVALAVPVDTLATQLPQWLMLAAPDTIWFDMGSTKAPLVQALAAHPRRRRLVATHPMAGTEYSGPTAAVEGLFEGKCCVICDADDSDTDALTAVESLYRRLGMHLSYMDSSQHDLHVAYVSHISHIASFALALTVLEKEKEENNIFELASGGFSSTVRLAKSNPHTWTPIFTQNRDNVLDVLDEYINNISRFRTLLIKKDFDTFHRLMEKANDIRRIIG
jgi:prephenate dehydrogenase